MLAQGFVPVYLTMQEYQRQMLEMQLDLQNEIDRTSDEQRRRWLK
jgi:hypothetical protein